MRWLKFRIGMQLAFRAAVGAGVSLAIARALNLDTPIFALIAAVIVTDRDPAETRKLAIRRIISTAIGGVCGVALAQVLGSSSWEAALAIFIAMILSIAVTQLGDPKIAAYLCALILINYASQSAALCILPLHRDRARHRGGVGDQPGAEAGAP